jgi:hypothetical protein
VPAPAAGQIDHRAQGGRSRQAFALVFEEGRPG